MKHRQAMLLLFILAALPGTLQSQLMHDSVDSPATAPTVAPAPLDLTYTFPTQRTMLSNYVFDAYGPYPIFAAALAAGIDQLNNDPPEWSQGAEGFGKRIGSNFGILAVGTTTRYGLSEAFRQDSLYYRCNCRGIMPRMSHAAISTFTARRRQDGQRVFSIPSLVAPYAGSFAAVYAWYPNRYGAKDAFRIGNYGLLAYMGANVGLEFFHNGPHSLLSRMHLNNTHDSPEPGPNHAPSAELTNPPDIAPGTAPNPDANP